MPAGASTSLDRESCTRLALDRREGGKAPSRKPGPACRTTLDLMSSTRLHGQDNAVSGPVSCREKGRLKDVRMGWRTEPGCWDWLGGFGANNVSQLHLSQTRKWWDGMVLEGRVSTLVASMHATDRLQEEIHAVRPLARIAEMSSRRVDAPP